MLSIKKTNIVYSVYRPSRWQQIHSLWNVSEGIAGDDVSCLFQSKLKKLAQRGGLLPISAKRQKIVPLPELPIDYETAVIETESDPAIEEADLQLS